MKKDVRPTENLVSLLIALAFSICVIYGGGVSWVSCIPCLLILSVAVCLNAYKKINLSLTVLLFVFTVLISFSAINNNGDIQNGIHEAVKLQIFVLSFILSQHIFKNNNCLKLIIVLSVLTSLVGFLCFIKVISIHEFIFTDTYYFGISRIQSFFKYANTAACFLAIGYFSSIHMYIAKVKNRFIVSSGIILLAFFLTVSKGSIILFLILGIIYAVIEDKYRSIFFVQSFIIGSCSLLCLFLCVKELYLPTVLISAVSILLATKFVNALNIPKKLLLAIIAFTVITICIIAVFYPHLFISFLSRLTYARNTLQYIFRNISPRILLGYGSGCWSTMQYSVQSTQYNVLYMHNAPVQMLFEHGIIATGIFFSIIFVALYRHIRRKNITSAIILSFIILHSLMDFDLSFASILMITGIVSGTAFTKTESEEKKYKRIFSTLFISFTVFICIVSGIYLLIENHYKNIMTDAYSRADFDSVLEYSEKAEKILPYDAQLQSFKSGVYELMSDETNALKCAEKAVQLSPYNPEYYETYMRLSYKENITDKCLHLLTLAPKQEHFQNCANKYAYEAYMRNEISKAEYETVLNYIKKCKRKETKK